MPSCPPRYRYRRDAAAAPGSRRQPPWVRRSRGRPPFGLHRQIFWSLVGSTLVASLGTFVLFNGWLSGHSLSLWRAVGFAAAMLGLLWGASWRLSWRLVAPLNRLVDVVQRFGEGDLSARAGLPTNPHDEVSHVANAIDTMADRLEQQVKDERQLLAVVSHELRTPLARIRVLTALARDKTDAGDMINQIDREVAEIDDLVAKVLARSRLTFGTMTTRTVSMEDAAREALERAGLSVGRLHRRGATDRATDVLADPTLLHRAIANIIENAERHGGGVEAIDVTATDDGVQVDVLDRGPGFQTGDTARRFDAFAPDSAGGRGSGLGLGLHLVSRIVVAHHGRVWADTRPEGGARVGFSLPAAPSAPAGPDSSATSSR